MDFSLTVEQELLRDSARTMLSRECPVSLVRAHMEGDPDAAGELWKALREWTVLAPADPKSSEEEGRSVSLCLFLEETGAVLAPGPYFATTALFAPLLAAVDHELLGAVLGGDVTGTVAVAGRDGAWVPNEEPVKHFVPEATRVDYVAAVAPAAPGSTGPDRPLRLLLYERPPAQEKPSIDPSRRVASVDLGTAVPVGNALEIGTATFASVMARATVAHSAELMGTVRWLFESTLEYAKSREQFDRPIGSFQAVKHKLANMALAREEAWSAVYYAAMTLDAEDPTCHAAAHASAISAGEAARLNAKDGIQIHGGIGYTYDHDLHLYLRRAIASEYLLGTLDWHRDRLADLVLGTSR